MSTYAKRLQRAKKIIVSSMRYFMRAARTVLASYANRVSEIVTNDKLAYLYPEGFTFAEQFNNQAA
jgi:hypothetical protein